MTTAAIPSTYTNPAAMNHWKIGATNLSAKAGNIPANLVQLNCFRLTKPYLSYNAKPVPMIITKIKSLPKMERIKKLLLLQMLFYRTAPLPNMIKMAI